MVFFLGPPQANVFSPFARRRLIDLCVCVSQEMVRKGPFRISEGEGYSWIVFFPLFFHSPSSVGLVAPAFVRLFPRVGGLAAVGLPRQSFVEIRKTVLRVDLL